MTLKEAIDMSKELLKEFLEFRKTITTAKYNQEFLNGSYHPNEETVNQLSDN